jgi:hypothetical protein
MNDERVPARGSSFFASTFVRSLRCLQLIASVDSIYSYLSIFFQTPTRSEQNIVSGPHDRESVETFVTDSTVAVGHDGVAAARTDREAVVTGCQPG